MKVHTVNVRSVALAKPSVKIKQKRMQGMYDNHNSSPADMLRKKRAYDFRKEFNFYVDENYGDILSKKDKQKLHDLVEEHYEEGCIENVADLHEHIEKIGKKYNILFD